MVPAVPDLRPMRDSDVPAVHELAIAAFRDLGRRLHEPPEPPPNRASAHRRVRHLRDTDPGGCWVTEDARGLTGAGIALLREGLWGLSLLVVRPDQQSTGIGRALLARALEYGSGAEAGSSSPPRPPCPACLRARRLRPAAHALRDGHAARRHRGVPGAALRAGRPRARRRRGSPRPRRRARLDLDALAAAGYELLTYPGPRLCRAWGAVKLLAALDDDAAAALLRTVLARTPAGKKADVDWLGADQQWAVDVVVAARLELRPGGAVCVRGEVGAMRPYLPGGAFL